MAIRLVTYGAVVDDNRVYDIKPITPDDDSPPCYECYSRDPDHDEDDAYSSNYTAAGLPEPIDINTHFRLISYDSMPTAQLGRRAIVVAGGDVHISLSPDQEDTIIIPSNILEVHPFWRASLRDCWVGAKTVEGSNIKRYELQFTSLRESILVGKKVPTAPEERDAKFRTLQGTGTYPEYAFGDYDEYDIGPRRTDFYDHAKATISAHKIGFALLCGYPLKAWRSNVQEIYPGGWTLIILKLLGWVHEYASLSSIVGRLTDFVLLHHESDKAPLTHLRIACHLKSKALYKIAMRYAVTKYNGFVYNDERGYPIYTKRGAQLRLLEELGGHLVLADRIVSTHKRYKERLHNVSSAIHELSLPWNTRHKMMSRKETRLTHLAQKIFGHWWDTSSKVSYHLFNVHDTLTRGTLDTRSIVGHWRSRNKHQSGKMAGNISFEEIVSAVQELFEQAADIASQLYDDEGKYRGADWLDRWSSVPDDLVDEHHVFP